MPTRIAQHAITGRQVGTDELPGLLFRVAVGVDATEIRRRREQLKREHAA